MHATKYPTLDCQRTIRLGQRYPLQSPRFCLLFDRRTRTNAHILENKRGNCKGTPRGQMHRATAQHRQPIRVEIARTRSRNRSHGTQRHCQIRNRSASQSLPHHAMALLIYRFAKRDYYLREFAIAFRLYMLRTMQLF